MNDKYFVIAIVVALTLLADGFASVSADDADKAKAALPPASTAPIDFIRDVQPIFQRACLSCHGDEKQKAGYRLDVRDVAMKEGDSYAPNIIVGKSAESPLIQFVAGSGDLAMPPEGERLSPSEIGILRAWIDQGAVWPDAVSGRVRDKHDLWSLKPLIQPGVPKDLLNGSTANAIDAFVRSKLAEHGYTGSPEADRRILIRRVYFDLIGLPPTPEEVDAFIADPSEHAYDALVDRLLQSPRYGERWARHWMDAAHFAESHGHDQDRIRENAWPYRDYLIEAMNLDKPYDRFIQEQVAADALFPDEPSLTAALGFLAAGPWDESSLRDIREDSIDRQIARYLDRDDMLTNVISNVNSLTVQCARCHDHKFDPIEQRDYYALQAVFSGVERANRKYDADPTVHRRRIELNRRKADLENRSPAVINELLSPGIQDQVANWERQRGQETPKWFVIDAEFVESAAGSTLSRLEDGSILCSGVRSEKDTTTFRTLPIVFQEAITATNAETSTNPVGVAVAPKETLSQITAIRLEVMPDDSLPGRGPGRAENGNFHLSEFEVFVDGKSQPESLLNPTADFNQTGWEIAKAIDQNEATAWGIDPQEGSRHDAIFEFKEPLAINRNPTGTPAEPIQLRIVLKQLHGRSHLIGRFRLSVTDAKTPVRGDNLPPAVVAALTIPVDQRSSEQRIELARFHQLEVVRREIATLPKPSLVYAAAADFDPDGSMHPPKGPRPINVLHRGDIRFPRAEALPGTLASVSGLHSQFDLPANAPESARRAALALWLTHRDTPLTWRSIVNRVWHFHFGRGLVSTLNDFGHMGDVPSHPELLDWLAVEFRDNGQTLKSLHRMILTSATYKQTCESPRSGASKSTSSEIDNRIANDADNRLLWRMNRTRLDAESIRDAILAISGLLDLRMGGPSDRQFDLKPGIHVTPMINYAKFDPNSDLGRRRSIYRFLFRTLPDPFMDSLDCPSGDQIIPVRSNSVTVQQALALWNDVFVATYCERIAERIARDVTVQPAVSTNSDTPLQKQIKLAVRLILGRNPTEVETNEFADYVNRHGMANLCRLLLNSNEFLFVN